MNKIISLLLLNTIVLFSQSVKKQGKEIIGPTGVPIDYSTSFNTRNTNTLLTCASSVVPPTTINGISITDTYNGSVDIYPNAWTSCIYTTPPNSLWLGSMGAFSYTMNFSAPINNLIIVLTATGGNLNELFTFTTNVGDPIISSTDSCFSVITGNVIQSGFGVPLGGGGGIFTITTSSGFSSLTISGPGGKNGSLISICSNSVVPPTCNVALPPLLSSASLTTICPLTTVNLNTISANNTPLLPGIVLTWHTATPPSAANEIAVAQTSSQLAGPIYYAAFYDSANSCYSATTPVTTILNTQSIPAFTQVNPICAGAALNNLPLTSNNGIAGIWSPAIDNTATTIYTFVHNPAQCAVNATMQIVVNPIVIPNFTAVATICDGTALAPLPTTSTNGISGTWSPTINNHATTNYAFTPALGQCAAAASMQIIINENPVASISDNCDGKNYVLTAHTQDQNNASYQWFDGTGSLIASTQSIIVTVKGMYSVVVTVNNCPGNLMFNASSVYCDIQRGISPNSDGNNDYFDLTNLHVRNLKIYNRYGTMVYNKENYINEWDGRSDNASELPDATYYYLIEFEAGKSKTGWIYVNRQH